MQVQLLVWIFVMRIAMLVASATAFFINGAIAKARFSEAKEMNFESPLTSLVWLTSIVSIALTYVISYLIIPNLGDDGTQWWKLATIISCGTLAGAVIPELVKSFTSTESRHVREGRYLGARGGYASLGILSGVCRRQFLRLLLGTGHGRVNVRRLSLVSLGGLGEPDDRSARVRFRPRGLRLPGHGPGHDCGGLLRSGDRQRAIRLRGSP